jgi:RimJ/RimL family protein N-acetyltransferase
MTEPRFTFRPLQRSDFRTLGEWLNRPHVAEWFGGPTTFEQVERDYSADVDSAVVRPFVAELEGVPVGWIQAYVVMGADPEWWIDESDPGARGIDQFLADASNLGRGLGSQMVAQFVARLFGDPQVTKVQTDPAPHNGRAIRAYEKAGFRRVGTVTTPDGPALLMRIHRADWLAERATASETPPSRTNPDEQR